MAQKLSQLSQIGYLILFAFLQAGVLPALALFLWGGIENNQFYDKVVFYYIYGFIGVITVAALYALYRVGKGKLFGYAFLHNPEEGLMFQSGIKPKWVSSFWSYLYIGIIIWTAMGLFSVATNTFFWQIPSLQQQFTETGQLIGATEPASFSETVFDCAVMFVVLSILRIILVNKFKVSEKSFLFLSIIPTAIVLGFFRVAMHLARYGGSDLNLAAVFFPAVIFVVLSLIFGSVVWYFVWHSTNNLLFQAKSMFNAETILIVVSIVLAIMTILFIFKSVLFKTPRKAQVSLNVIIISAIALLCLVIVSIIFMSRLQSVDAEQQVCPAPVSNTASATTPEESNRFSSIIINYPIKISEAISL